jgi:hypothetical protein
MAPMSTYVIEVNVNRLGSDITSVDLADPVPEECQLDHAARPDLARLDCRDPPMSEF